MRPAPFLAVLAAFAAPGALAGSVPSDPYDPVLLNERAVGLVRAGDLAGARILLERAARLAPFDEIVKGNLRTLRAFEAGERAPPSAAASPPSTPPPPSAAPERPAAPVPAEPPAPWPAVPGPR